VMPVRRRAWKIEILEESDGGVTVNGTKRESESGMLSLSLSLPL
jgi:hypothetical protein